MPWIDHYCLRGRTHLSCVALRLAIFSNLIWFCAIGPAWAQTPPSIAAPPVPQGQAAVSSPAWRELTPRQRTILAPLAPEWESIEPVRKLKWLSLAQTYPKLPPEEQAKLQGRMAEWAALSPRQRTLARLNFAESKKVPASDRAADWDAYKALPPEDRQKFVAKAAVRPKSAALAPKRTTQDKVTPVPVTRRTPKAERANPDRVLPTINKRTLLPQALKPTKAAASVPVPVPAQATAPVN